MDVHRFRAFSGIFGFFRALFGQTGTNGEFILYCIVDLDGMWYM